jgi:ABC-type multidrug transport system ATPase subunit
MAFWLGLMIKTLSFQNITFGYADAAPLFRNLNIDFPSDPIVWLRAAPGHGKSSALKILAGLIMPTSGRYLINGENVLDMSFQEFMPYRLRMGYSFDSGGLLSNRTLYENLLLPLMFHQICSLEEAEQRIGFWMNRFNLTKVQNLRPFSVTGRERKSVLLLRAFLHYPEMVLLDEPMVSLKEDGRKAFSELAAECASKHGLKRIIFCAEQDMPLKYFNPIEVHLDAYLDSVNAQVNQEAA